MTLKDICKILNTKVSFDRFRPVEMLLYGFVGLILTSLVVYGLSKIIQ